MNTFLEWLARPIRSKLKVRSLCTKAELSINHEQSRKCGLAYLQQQVDQDINNHFNTTMRTVYDLVLGILKSEMQLSDEDAQRISLRIARSLVERAAVDLLSADYGLEIGRHPFWNG